MEIRERIERVKAGDSSCFYELIEERKNYLYRIAYMYVKNDQDAMDILSEAVFKAYSSLSKLRDSGAFHTWITRIVVNCAINFTRKHRGILSLNDDILIETMTYKSRGEEYIDLYDAVDKLTGKYKTVVILRYFEDFSVEEIAKTLNCPQGTVKSYLHRAVKKLRLELEDDSFEKV